MDLFRSTPKRPPSALLVTPPPRRMSTAAGDRLATILENGGAGASRDFARRPSSIRSTKSWSSKIVGSPQSTSTGVTAPPSYTSKEWDMKNYGQEKKPGTWKRLAGRRGGLGRCLIIGLVVLLIIIALAVGLGVGLTRKNPSRAASSGDDDELTQPGMAEFPLGQYSFVTTVRSIQTDCTSNPSTWRCYPYSTSEGPNSTSGLALFNWVVTGSSQNVVSTSDTTGAAGSATQLTVSSSGDPFGIILRNQSLTYVNDNNNPRYTFSFVNPKNVAPSTAIDASNVATTCWFNQTQFAGTLYLSNSRSVDYPGEGLSDSPSVQGGYPRWPYAVEIREVSAGGEDTPACYATTNGVLGRRIGGLTPQPQSSQCSCNYRNFDA